MPALLVLVAASTLGACVAAGGSECIGDETVCPQEIEDDGGRGGGGGGRGDAGGGGGTDDGGLGFDVPPVDTFRCDGRTCDEVTATGQPLPDADLDGVPDCIEGYADPDADGDPACDDLDSDNDGLPDSSESLDDPDGDGIPGFLDTDSDNDNIPDIHEGTGDADADGRPNYLDDDSDGDSWPDSVEYGREPGSGEPPARSDADGEPDFLDEDSDGDGLLDSIELGCPVYSERTRGDSDGDGFNDLLEYAFVPESGSSPSAMCDPSRDIRGVVDFYFELPFEGDELHDTLEFGTDINRGDVVFNMDTTGSMGGEIDTLKRSLSGTLIPALRTEIPNVGIGVSRFDDFPCSGYGSGIDVPFQLLQRVTLNDADAQRGVNALGTHYGDDYYESGVESLFQLATGAGSSSCGSWAAFNAAAGLVPGVADGTRGGAGFRDGALPIMVHITDAPTHARGEDGYPYGASRAEATDAINALGGKVIGVVSGTDPRGELETLARQTGSVVPACAWDGRRPSGCGEGQCCTGQSGRGRGSEAGNCPLVFDITDNGGGLDTSIVSGIAALVNFAPITVTTRVTRDEEEFLTTGIDTSLFLKSITPVTAVAPESPCGASFTPTPADTNGDGTLDGFINVIPGTRVFFDIGAYNDFVRALASPQVFIAYIDVIGNGTAVLDTLTVTILVPPGSKL